MNSRILLLLGILLGGLPALALAVPQCSDIFTDPPTGNHFNDGFVPPANLPPSRGNLTCRQSWFDPFFVISHWLREIMILIAVVSPMAVS